MPTEAEMQEIVDALPKQEGLEVCGGTCAPINPFVYLVTGRKRESVYSRSQLVLDNYEGMSKEEAETRAKAWVETFDQHAVTNPPAWVSEKAYAITCDIADSLQRDITMAESMELQHVVLIPAIRKLAKV